MAPKSKPTFHTLEARLASFSEAKIRGAKGRGKARVSSWPHESPTPVALAEAGFYYNPAVDSNDNITCFLCQTSLDQWEKDDNPAQEHWHNSKNCAWAYLRSNAWTSTDAAAISNSDLNPNSDFSLNCRLETFSDWPHEKKQGWHPTGLIMAKAGFYYNPIQPGDDEASCCYCGINLDAWEQDDNPVEEHRKRSPECLCFQPIMEIATPMADRSTRSAVSGAFYGSAATAAAAETDDDEGNESILHIKKMKSRKRGAEHDGDADSDAPFRKVSRTENARVVSTASVATVTESNVKDFDLQHSTHQEDGKSTESHSVAEHDESVCLIPASKRAATAVTCANESVMSVSTVADSSISSAASSAHIPGAFPVPKKKRGRPRKVKPAEQATQAPPEAKMPVEGELKKIPAPAENKQLLAKLEVDEELNETEHKESIVSKDVHSVQDIQDMHQAHSLRDRQDAQIVSPNQSIPEKSSPGFQVMAPVPEAEEQQPEPVQSQSPQQEAQPSTEEHKQHVDESGKQTSPTAEPLAGSIAGAAVKHSSEPAASSETSNSTSTSAYQSFDGSPHQTQHSLAETKDVQEMNHMLEDDQIDAGISDQDNNWEQFSSSSISTHRPAAPVVSFYSEPDDEQDSIGHSASGPTTPVRETEEPKWTAADVDAVFSILNENLDESSAPLSQHEMDKSLVDWTRELAMRQSDQLKQQCEAVIRILEEEGARAIQAVQSMPVRS